MNLGVRKSGKTDNQNYFYVVRGNHIWFAKRYDESRNAWDLFRNGKHMGNYPKWALETVIYLEDEVK